MSVFSARKSQRNGTEGTLLPFRFRYRIDTGSWGFVNSADMSVDGFSGNVPTMNLNSGQNLEIQFQNLGANGTDNIQFEIRQSGTPSAGGAYADEQVGASSAAVTSNALTSLNFTSNFYELLGGTIKIYCAKTQNYSLPNTVPATLTVLNQTVTVQASDYTFPVKIDLYKDGVLIQTVQNQLTDKVFTGLANGVYKAKITQMGLAESVFSQEVSLGISGEITPVPKLAIENKTDLYLYNLTPGITKHYVLYKDGAVFSTDFTTTQKYVIQNGAQFGSWKVQVWEDGKSPVFSNEVVLDANTPNISYLTPEPIFSPTTVSVIGQTVQITGQGTIRLYRNIISAANFVQLILGNIYTTTEYGKFLITAQADGEGMRESYGTIFLNVVDGSQTTVQTPRYTISKIGNNTIRIGNLTANVEKHVNLYNSQGALIQAVQPDNTATTYDFTNVADGWYKSSGFEIVNGVAHIASEWSDVIAIGSAINQTITPVIENQNPALGKNSLLVSNLTEGVNKTLQLYLWNGANVPVTVVGNSVNAGIAGTYVLANLQPGTYQVSATEQGKTESLKSLSRSILPQTGKPVLTVEGRVLRVSGLSANNVTLRLYPSGKAILQVGNVNSSYFEFNNMENNIYQVTAEDIDRSESDLSDPITLNYTPNFKLIINLENPAGKDMVFALDPNIASHQDPQLNFQKDTPILPEGQYFLHGKAIDDDSYFVSTLFNSSDLPIS